MSADAIERYPIASGQMLRCLGASLILVLVARCHLPRLTRRETGLLLLLSLTGVIAFNVVILFAVREADPTVVGVIVSCLPVVTALAAPAVQRRRPSPRVVAAALVVASGAAVVQYSGGTATIVGVLLSFTALGLEAVFALLAIPLLARLPPIAIATYSCAIAVPLLAIAALIGGEFPEATHVSSAEGLALLNLAFVVTPLAFVLWYVALRDLGVERAALFSGVLPVSVLLITAAFIETSLGPGRVLGVVMVAVGITLGIQTGNRGRRGIPRSSITR